MINNFDLYHAFNLKAKTLTLPMAYNFIDDDDKTNAPQDTVSIMESMLDQNGNVIGLSDSSSEFLRGIYQLGVYVPKTMPNSGNTAKFTAQAIKELFLRQVVSKNTQTARIVDVFTSQLMNDDTHNKIFVRMVFTAKG